jgi:hypothetical protein
VQDTTRSDAPAETVAEAVLRGIRIKPGSSSVRFTLRHVHLAPGRRYTLRAHADLDGDGRVSRGDHISTQSYPILPGTPSQNLTVVMREVI